MRRGNEQRIVKGAPAAIASIAPLGPTVTAELDTLTRQGYRVLAVAGGPPQQLTAHGTGRPQRSTEAGLEGAARRTPLNGRTHGDGDG